MDLITLVGLVVSAFLVVVNVWYLVGSVQTYLWIKETLEIVRRIEVRLNAKNFL